MARPTATVESLELLGDRPAAVLRDGSRLSLTLRRTEILARLDSLTQGCSAEELAYELHGDAGIAATIRTEMFRVRSCWALPWRRTLPSCCGARRVFRCRARATAASRLRLNL